MIFIQSGIQRFTKASSTVTATATAATTKHIP
jgi:hypothetical protein